MKYLRLVGFLLIILIFNNIGFGQQKPLYSQYMFNAFLINPAAAEVKVLHHLI